MDVRQKSREDLIRELAGFRQKITESAEAEAERLKAAENLKEMERRYTMLFNGMDSGFAVCELILDPDFNPIGYKFIEVNPAFEQIVGLPHDEIVGRTAAEILSDTDPEWVEEYADVAKTRTPARFERYFESMDRYFQVAVFRAGRNMFAANYTDITQQKKAEEALRLSEQFHRGIIEDQVDMICRYGPGGDLTFANDSYRHFYDGQERLAGHSFMPMIYKDDTEVVREAFKAICESTPAVTYEYRVRFPDGRIRWVEWTDRGIFDAHGRISAYQSVGRDVTERRESLEELEQHRRNLEELVEERTATLSEANKKLEQEIAERSRAEEEGNKLRGRLQNALDRALSGYLAICSKCKRIRDDAGNWIPLEMYMGGRTEAEFTHGVCPYCMKKLYPNLDKKAKKKKPAEVDADASGA